MASTISKGFSRNYSPQELTALATHINSSTKPLGSTLSQLNNAGIPYEDLGMLLSKMPGSRGMIAELQGQATNRMPGVGVDMGGAYGGVAPMQGPYTPSATNPGAMAGLASQMSSQMPSSYGVAGMEDRIPSRMPPFGYGVAGMEDRIPREGNNPPRLPRPGYIEDPIDRIPRYITPVDKSYYPPSQPIGIGPQDDPSQGYQNPGSSIAQMQRDLYPPQQPIAYGGDGGGGVYGPGGMFPDNRFPTERIPERRGPFMTDPYRGDPIYPGYSVDPYTPPQQPGYSVDPYTPYMPNPNEYAPRAPNGGISNEVYPGDQYMPTPRDDLFQTFNPFNDYGGNGGG